MKKALQYLNKFFNKPPQIGVVLGSGLHLFCNQLNNKSVVKYEDIPGFRKTSIKGHKGEFVLGSLNDKEIICANGRFHFYEGYAYNEVAIIIDIFKSLGCEMVIMTNASGCTVSEWAVGDLMLINGHLDYSFLTSNENPNVIQDERYDGKLLHQVKAIAQDCDVCLREGVYAWTTGPSYETNSEVTDILSLGGNAVGMSGLPEIEKIYDLDMKMIGICCLTNFASGISKEELTHDEVVRVAEKSRDSFIKLLVNIILKLKY